MKQSLNIIFLGILSSIALIVVCIYFKYDMVMDRGVQKRLVLDTDIKELKTLTTPKIAVIPQLLQPKAIEKKELPIKQEIVEEKPVSTESKTLKVSSLDYRIEKELITIDGKMPILENNDTLKIVLMSQCKAIRCDKKILFSSEQVYPKWKKLATETINLFNNEKMKGANLKVDGNAIYISGEFTDKESMLKLNSILKPYLSIYSIKNNTTVKEVIVTLSKAEKTITEVSKNNSIEIVEEKISEILKEKHINFYKSRAKITKKGKNTLDEIIVILRKQKGIHIEVHGHTDASGKEKINQWISAERAKSVKKYLESRGLSSKNIVAFGFGETKLLVKDRPYSAINRRVEIKIKRR